MLDDPPGFQNAVRNVLDWVSFDVNTKPQVFETTIRVLGGLLSGHMFASQPNQPFYLPWYRDQLLMMAYDLGNRLLPAFSTPTGLPFARVRIFSYLRSLSMPMACRLTCGTASSEENPSKLVCC